VVRDGPDAALRSRDSSTNSSTTRRAEGLGVIELAFVTHLDRDEMLSRYSSVSRGFRRARCPCTCLQPQLLGIVHLRVEHVHAERVISSHHDR
jgi:hypothetical protein